MVANIGLMLIGSKGFQKEILWFETIEAIKKTDKGESLDTKLNVGSGEGIIRPMKRSDDPLVGPDALMVMIPSDLDNLVKHHDTNKIDRINMGSFNLYLIKDESKSPLTLAGPFLGAPQAVMGCERIIALGVTRIWVFGWCGSIDPALRIGDLLIPTSGVSEEGTSQHYPIGERSLTTDDELNGVLERSLKEKSLHYRKGAVWTTDAPFRETPGKVKEFQDQGVLAVEMEMSALMTLSIFRKVKLSGLLVVSDELFELKWRPGFSKPEFSDALGLAREIILDLARSMNHD